MKEIWKPCIYDGVVYEGYLVSNKGNIKRLSRPAWNGQNWWTMPDKIIKPSINNSGYAIVGLQKDGKRKWCLVSRLVANAFYNLVPLPDTKYTVDHRDTNKLNNEATNLVYVTYTGNNNNPITKKKMSIGSMKRGC